MKTFDASEIIEHIDEVLRMVEEDGETIEITNYGKVIAHFAPVRRPQYLSDSAKRNVWADLDSLYASSEKLRSEPLSLAAWHQTLEMSCCGDSAHSMWKHIAAEISAHWPPDVSAIEALRDVRREL